jgi:hypothetical protein
MKDNVSIMDTFKSPFPERIYQNNPSSIPTSPFNGRTGHLPTDWFENQSVREAVPVDDEFTMIYANDKNQGTTLRRLFRPNQFNDQFKSQNEDNVSAQNFSHGEDQFIKSKPHQKLNKAQTGDHIDDSSDKNEDNDEMEDENDPDGKCFKKKFNKGLKMLSVIVRDIVVDKQSTTYKEVADIILRDTIKFENLNINSQLEIAKEEQNIKRRVYDALNVLIAAGILVKEGKRVRKNEVNKKIKINMKRLDINTLKSKLVTLLEE